MERASRKSWKAKDLPEQREVLGFANSYTAEEFALIQQGLIPEAMEDKWFIYFDEPNLFFHRSWTGDCIYVLKFAERQGGAQVVESWANRDTNQYRETDIAYDGQLVQFLISALLLKLSVSFPVRATQENLSMGLLQHVISGTAHPEQTLKEEDS